MGIIIGKRHIDTRLEKFKTWKAKGSPQGYGKPTSHLIPQKTFDFPSDEGDLRHRVAWASSLEKLEADFRRVKPAHKVLTRLRHTGWFGDTENQEFLHVGHVMQLPGKNGKERWLAMVVVDDCDGVRVELDTIYESAEDAAHAADESARIQAEHADDYRRAESERAKAAAKEAAKKIDSEARWALACIAEAFKFGEAEGIREKFAEMAGNTVEEVDRMLAAFKLLEDNWGSVSIELDKCDF